MDTRPLSELPLYVVQERALEDTNLVAQVELGRRYAAGYVLNYKTDRHRQQVALQYTRGWSGEQDPYFWKGGNFAAPLRRAYSAGKRDRKATEEAKAALHARQGG